MKTTLDNLQVISAGAGSGKTFTLTQKLKALLLDKNSGVRPEGIIATTFTKAAAAELKARVREALLEAGELELAAQLENALIGTVNGVCGQLLADYAFELGLSPRQQVIAEEDSGRLFLQAMDRVLDQDALREMNRLAHRFSMTGEYRSTRWQDVVKDLAGLARSNHIDADGLREQGQTNVEQFLHYCGKPSKRISSAAARGVAQGTLDVVDLTVDKTKGTREACEDVERFIKSLHWNSTTWAEWVAISKVSGTKKSAAAFDDLRELTAELHRSAEFQTEFAEFTQRVFDLAAKSLTAYQEFKRQRGLVDFVDQEALLLQALDRPEVLEDLASRIDLLMVDEFQDTSPLQLAVFLKLTQCAKQSIWVGDVKQAIYGFRGTDPQLMQAVIAQLQASGNVSYLDQSWRSQPELVQLSNEIFTPAFAPDLSEEQVALNVPSVRDEPRDHPALLRWNLKGRNKDQRMTALVAGLQHVKQQAYALKDKNGSTSSSLSWGDMAVLCKSNSDISAVATTLSNAGIPAKYPAPGLLETPEATLVKACLRFLIDERDTLARTEIHSLTNTLAPDVWLQSRLDYQQQREDNKERDDWLLAGDDSNEYLLKLQALRSELRYLSPEEVLQRIYSTVGIHQRVLSWKADDADVQRRLSNLSALLERAERYQEQCESSAHAATVSGFVLWLGSLSGDDNAQAVASDGDAVTIRTHHGAKGLEWKVVVLMGLDKPLRSTLWSAKAYSNAEFDMARPLANRQLHYWPYPFGGASTGIRLLDKINESAFAEQFDQQMRAEQLRLLYVSFTRAREILILPQEGKPKADAWRSVLNADWLLEQDFSLPSGKALQVQSKEWSEADLKAGEDQCSERTWFAAQEPLPSLSAYISPSAAEPVPCEVADPVLYGERLTLPSDADMQAVGNALHQIIAVDFINREQGSLESSLDEDQRTALIEQILSTSGLGGKISAQAVTDNLDKFTEHLLQKHKSVNHKVELPLVAVNQNNQQLTGWVDMLLEVEGHKIIIDHKSFPGAASELKKVAEKYSGQLAVYADALGKGSKTELNLAVLGQSIS